jgi:hypothetical protein
MLVFLAADSKRLDELMDSARSFLAWEDIVSRADSLNLSPQQAKQAIDRRDDAGQAADLRIGQTYVHALVPEQPNPGQPITWSVEKAEGQEVHLAARTSARLTRAGLLTDVSAPRTVRLDLDGKLAKAWESGHVSVGALWGFYAQYPYLTRMKNREVLVSAIRDVVAQFTWDSEGFALADAFDSSTGRYTGLVIPDAGAVAGAITDATLLVNPIVALAQTPPTAKEVCGKCGQGVHEGDCSPGLPTLVTCTLCGQPVHAGSCATPSVAVSNTRYFGTYEIDAERYGRDLTRLSQEILQHLASLDGVDLNITVEIQARRPEGFPDDKVRVILENARALKFKQSGFEGQ